MARADFSSPEAQLLIAAARTSHNTATAGVIRKLIAAPLDWDAVAALAARHRVRPMLVATLSQLGFGACPPSILRELRGATGFNRHRSLQLTAELFKVLDLLASHRIPAAPFKGPTLAMLAYGNAALREAGDLDVLVRRRHMIAARQILIENGFVPGFPTASPAESAWLEKLSGDRAKAYCLEHAEHHLFRERGNINVDLHWHLVLRQFALQSSAADLWDWLTPRHLAGRTLLTFPPEQLLLILCINGTKDCWRRLDRICDIAELIARHPTIDLERVLSMARRIGAARMVRLGLRLAVDLFQTSIPTNISRDIKGDIATERLVAKVRASLFEADADSVEAAGIGKAWFHLQTRDRLRDRIAFILAMAEPTVGDWAAVQLPRSLHLLYFLLRPLRLLWRYAF